MKTIQLICSLLFFNIFISCQQHASQKESLQANDASSQAPTGSEKSNHEKIPVGGSAQYQADTSFIGAAAYINWNKKIIKSAVLTLEVKDFKQFHQSMQQAVRRFGGYIAKEELHTLTDKLESLAEIKIPVDQFEAMMNELSVSDATVIERTINSQDVTGEFVDTRARLAAKKNLSFKYLEFLKASKNVEEVLKVQEEINRIQEEIEAAAGRVDYLSHEAAYSTIRLTFFQPVVGAKPNDHMPSFLVRIGYSFKSGAGLMADVLVSIIALWPLLLLISGAIFIFKARKTSKTNIQKS